MIEDLEFHFRVATENSLEPAGRTPFSPRILQKKTTDIAQIVQRLFIVRVPVCEKTLGVIIVKRVVHSGKFL